MASNHVIKKVKPQYKLVYKVIEGIYQYYQLLGIYPYTDLIQITDILSGIQNCVTVVGKCIFWQKYSFMFLLICDDLDYCYKYDDGTKETYNYKVLFKAIIFFQTKKISLLFKSENTNQFKIILHKIHW